MKKSNLLEPTIADESVLVQFTDAVITDKGTSVKVPNGFSAIVLVDEKAVFRIEAGREKKISEYGKEYINRHCRVAFVRTKLLPAMLWGFGNIQVNNGRLNEAYRVGANGNYIVEIVEAGKLISSFNVERNITLDMIREKTMGLLRNLGTTVLAEYFASSDISVFEISSKTVEIRARLISQLNEERTFTDMGLAVKELTVANIHVPDEDIESIRGRISEIVRSLVVAG